MADRILIRLPSQLELFCAATAVVHDYVMQQARQIAQGMKTYDDLKVTVEFGHEEQFFFSPVFPRLELILRGQTKLSRTDWDCVVDMTSIDRALSLSMIPQKHLTETWGIMHGANPKRIPEMGCLGTRINETTIDVIIDENFEDGEKLRDLICSNFPSLKVVIEKVDGCRAGIIFNKIASTKMYIGKRSGATYVAAMMKRKQFVELYENDLPLWFLSKNTTEGNYKVFYGKQFTAEMVWIGVQELMEKNEWISPDMTFQDAHLPA